MNVKKLVLLLALPGALALQAPPAHAAPYLTTSSSVAAYQFNVNKMDKYWQGWVNDIKTTNGPVPDVILGQDFQNEAEVTIFQNYISHATDGFNTPYAHVSSDSSTQFPNLRVIFWRTARFTYAQSEAYKGWGDTTASGCTDNALNTNAILVQLLDTASVPAKIVTAASFKTPPKDTNECAWRNMQKATGLMERSGWPGSLHLIGTDANAPDYDGSYTCWYRNSVRALSQGCTNPPDLGWSDPMYDNCVATGTTRACLDTHWTHTPPNRRIDFLFAKRGLTAEASSTARKTIDKLSCQTFSDHCSVRAVVNY